jgi:hypothetical protein
MAAKSSNSRRTVVGSAGIGLAAAAASSFAKGNSEMAPQELQNPADKYPEPPYKQQSRAGQPPSLAQSTSSLPQRMPATRRAGFAGPPVGPASPDTMATSSAGILMYRNATQSLEVLLVHPGGPFWRNKDDGAWSIPKGEIDAGERAEDIARREFMEELGSAASGLLRPLGEIRQRGGKRVHAFAVEAISM